MERAYGLSEAAIGKLTATYDVLRQLHRDERDHIWGFVARNLVRPVWLSQEEQRAHMIIGNPPWLPYRYIDEGTQKRFRDLLTQSGKYLAIPQSYSEVTKFKGPFGQSVFLQFSTAAFTASTKSGTSILSVKFGALLSRSKSATVAPSTLMRDHG